MLGTDEKYDTDEEAQMSDLSMKRERSLSISHSDDIEVYRNKVLKLESWKTEIGIPAIEQVEKLQSDLTEMNEKEIGHDTQILAMKQENKTLQLQLDTFEEEHEKWEIERKDLLSQLDTIEHQRNTSLLEEKEWADSVKEQYHKIDNLTLRHRRSSTDLLQSQRTISELLEENTAIGSTNDELKILNNQNQEIITELKQKLKDVEIKLDDLQNKYDQVMAQYLAEQEKSQKMYRDIITDKLNEYNPSSSKRSSPNALPIPFNPSNQTSDRSLLGSDNQPLFRRRSRSFDSDGANDRLIMHHLDMNGLDDVEFDEKEAFDHLIDEEKIKEDIKQELLSKFEREKQEINDQYETLKKQYSTLQRKYDRLRTEMEQINIQNNHQNRRLFQNKQREEMDQDNDNSFCFLFPWNCR